MTSSELFLKHSVDFLAEHYLPKIEQCVGGLNEEELWWRPNESSNSIGNLILHLSGNLRQWIVSGIGGEPDVRVRQQEFDERKGIPKEDLLEKLRSTVRDAMEVLGALKPDTLAEKRSIQGKEATLMYAIYHVVEHFSMHTGQIIQIAKERTGKDLQFYGFEKGIPKERWRRKGD